MTVARGDVRRVFLGRAVGVAFAFWAAVWLLWEFAGALERLSDPLVGILYPVWLPVYLAILFASGLRNVYLPWLGSGALFHLAVVLFLYLEAIVLAGIYRGVRGAVYRGNN